jgi:RND family efflux transporter MFP subunit
MRRLASEGDEMATGLREPSGGSAVDEVMIGAAPTTGQDWTAFRAAQPLDQGPGAVAPPRERAPAKRRWTLRWVAAAAVVVAAGSAAWYIRGQTAKVVAPATAIVARRDLSATVVATGTIRAVVGGEVKVGSRIPGRVERLAVQVGDRVKAGQAIATLEQDELRATLEKTRAEVAAAEARAAQVRADLVVVRATAETSVAREVARLSAARARLKLVLDGARPEEIAQAEAAVRQADANVRLVEANAERSRRLFDQELIARQEAETMRRERDVVTAQLSTAREQLALARNRYRPEEVQIARDEVRQAEAGLAQAGAEVGRIAVKESELLVAQRQVDQARAAVKAAEANVGYATITAPIAGIVASVSTQQGETVTSGSAAAQAPTFVTIIDLTRLEAHAYVDETDIGKVHVGQSASFTVDAFPEREFAGTITAIYPKALIQLNVVTYDVVIAIDNRDGLLRPDMTTNVTVTVARRERALAVPNGAVRREGAERFVLVADGDRLVRRSIKAGWRDKSHIEVLNGVKEGEQVVVGDVESAKPTPAAALPPGAK